MNADPPRRPRAADILRNPVHLLAFGFGAGLAPRAPGTAGTLVAVPIAFGLALLPPWWRAAVIVALCIGGVWICGHSARRLGVHDYPGIVFDEIAGYQVAVAIAPYSWITLGVCFVLFRFFDILKPSPIGWLDRHVRGGTGIMVDDIAAGIYAGVIWLAVAQWIH